MHVTQQSLLKTINQFERKDAVDDSFIIPPDMFIEKKPFVLFEIPYCEANEIVLKRFLKKFHTFTEDKYDSAIK